ncbi:hypothetical protein [Sphingopyxis sp. KK2]|uniref:hypothetical protein n=1 Tax=Sphingopyxis sp. KK2 TaxID=1855727 RepID=UPI001181B1AD|nr:hypothetical protein [Sphingopyxis sp. KK2]
MFDALETAGGLTKRQEKRLIALARACTAMPWSEDDDRLRSLKLVQRSGWPLSARFAEINAWGWTVALHVTVEG